MTDARMILVNPDDPPPALDDRARAEVAALARRQRQANGVVMKAITYVGGQVEDGLSVIPAPMRKRIEGVARAALEQSYGYAAQSREGVGSRIAGDRAHKIIATVSGAIGGFGGLPAAVVELPVTTTVIFRAVQDVAAAHGEDPLAEDTRLECLRVFGSGGPGAGDDGIDTSFLGARLTLTGPALNALLTQVAPRFAAMIGQKLATQAVPVIGAAAGAATNLAFTGYYVEMAHVHFGLRRLIRTHGEAPVLDLFHSLALSKAPVNRA